MNCSHRYEVTLFCFFISKMVFSHNVKWSQFPIKNQSDINVVICLVHSFNSYCWKKLTLLDMSLLHVQYRLTRVTSQLSWSSSGCFRTQCLCLCCWLKKSFTFIFKSAVTSPSLSLFISLCHRRQPITIKQLDLNARSRLRVCDRGIVMVGALLMSRGW